MATSHSHSHDEPAPQHETASPERLWYPEKPEWLDRDPVYLKLEIGAQGSDGFNRYDLYYQGATIVTVDAPQDLDARGNNGFGERGVSTFDETESQYSEKLIRRYLERDGKVVPPGKGYHHESIEADGRHLGFEDGTFSDVLFCNIMGDPSIADADVEALVNEALRVGQRLIIKEEFTPFVCKERLDNSNLEEAGLDVYPYFIPDDGLFKNESIILFRQDKNNTTPFKIMTRDEQRNADWKRMIEENERLRAERKTARREKRAERKYERRTRWSKGWMGKMNLVKPPARPEHIREPEEDE
jgi:hypothetical protein